MRTAGSDWKVGWRGAGLKGDWRVTGFGSFLRISGFGFRVLQLHILRPDFEAFVLVFPDHSRIRVEQPGGELAAGMCQQPLGFLRRAFERVVVVANGLALAIVPMGDGMDGRVF